MHSLVSQESPPLYANSRLTYENHDKGNIYECAAKKCDMPETKVSAGDGKQRNCLRQNIFMSTI